MVLWPEATRSSIYGWLEFATAYIPVLAMYGYMACGGSSRLNVGMSVWPRWDVKVLLLSKFILDEWVPGQDKHNMLKEFQY